MSSPGFEPRPNGNAVSVANHSTGWAAVYFLTYSTDLYVNTNFTNIKETQPDALIIYSNKINVYVLTRKQFSSISCISLHLETSYEWVNEQ
ncbi:UNVERIFIED_CONTAM: hypothetical protein NCL1_26609 [Trichonephila clavipes]